MSTMLKKAVLPVAMGVTLLAGCATTPLVSSKIETSVPEEFVTLIAEDGGIHTDRRRMSPGFYDAKTNQTFITWMGENAHAFAAVFDHETNVWSEPKLVGESPFPDKHNYPHMVKDADGHIIIFYGCHNSPLYMTKAPTAMSIDGEWAVTEIAQAPNSTYPMPVVRENGEIIVFFRETMQNLAEQPAEGAWPTDYRPLKYITSTDGGDTWSDSVNALDPWPRPEDNLGEIYAGEVVYQPASKDRPERLLLTWGLAGGGVKGLNKHNYELHNVYFASMDPETKDFYSAAGENLGQRIDNDEMEEHALAVVTDNNDKVKKSTGYSPQVSYSDDGNPILVYRNTPSIGSAAWDGNQWQINKVVSGFVLPQFDHDLEKTGDTSFQAYVMSSFAPMVRVFDTQDMGANWTEVDRYQFPDVEKVAKLILVDDYHPEVKYIVTELSGPSTEVTTPTRNIYSVAEHAVAEFPDLPKPVIVKKEEPVTPAAAPAANMNLELLDKANMPVNAPWQNSDIGDVLIPGFAGWEGEQLVVSASGVDIWNKYDQFHWAYSTIKGDFTFIARVDNIDGAHEWAKAGIMIRGSLEDNAAEVLNTYTPRNGVNLQWRLMKGFDSSRDRSTNNYELKSGWVKLVREGNTVTGYDSQDGVDWFQRNKPVTMRLPEEVYVGFATTSHSPMGVVRSTFSNFSIVKH